VRDDLRIGVDRAEEESWNSERDVEYLVAATRVGIDAGDGEIARKGGLLPCPLVEKCRPGIGHQLMGANKVVTVDVRGSGPEGPAPAVGVRIDHWFRTILWEGHNFVRSLITANTRLVFLAFPSIGAETFGGYRPTDRPPLAESEDRISPLQEGDRI